MLGSGMLAVLAETAGTGQPSADIVGWLLAQGPVGVLALVIAYGWKRERDRADAERTARDALSREVIDKIIPAVLESTRATTDVLAFVRGQNGAPRA